MPIQITLTTKSFEQLVKANNFGYKYINKNYKPENPKEGKVNIELWHPNKTTTNQEFLDYCKSINGRPATFNETLQFALDNPDEQKKYPLVTYDGEQLCGLALYSDGGRRKLRVCRNYPGNYWHDSVRFLVVPAPVPAASSGSLGDSEIGKPLDSWPLEILEINGVTYERRH